MSDEIIWKNVSDELEFKNGRGNPFGWSQEEIHHDGKRIGWVYCGALEINSDDYKLDGNNIFRGLTQTDWEAVEHIKAMGL